MASGQILIAANRHWEEHAGVSVVATRMNTGLVEVIDGCGKLPEKGRGLAGEYKHGRVLVEFC